MDCIILAGGKGTRLKNTVTDVPKPLAPINNRPFLDILIQQVKNIDIIDKIILAVGYKSEQIIEYYKNDLNIVFSNETVPLGTGGALKNALKLSSSENILVLNGDSYNDFNFKSMLNLHNVNHADLTIAYKLLNKTFSYGNLLIEKKSQKILSFEEKKNKNSGYISLGVYIIKKDIFDNMDCKDAFSLENDFFPKITKLKRVYGFNSDTLFIDIGTRDTYWKAQSIFT